MTVFESIRIALDMLGLHKMRSFLTMLGVIIGVMAVCLIVIVVEGFQSFIRSQFSSLAADGIYIVYDPSRLRNGQGGGRLQGVDDDLKAYITQRVPTIRNVSGLVECGSHTVKYKDLEVKDVKVTATDVNNHALMRKEVTAGRLIDQNDVDRMSNAAVISEKLRDEIFGSRDPLGRILQLPGITLEVVGVMKRPPQIGGPPSENVIEIPYSTAQRKWIGGRRFTYLMAQAKEGTTVEQAMDDLWRQLMVLSDNRPIFRVDSNQSILNVFGTVIGGVGIVLSGIAALSLLVGGIGIMNIMLVSVKERTREIGLRKALGARKGAVLTQFLVEAAVLSLVGGIIGMILAWALGQGVTALTAAVKWPNEKGLQAGFPILWAFAAMGFSAAIGVIFGFFPAFSASNLDPIVALRYE